MKSVKVPALELFLHEMIPLAKAMGVGVEVTDFMRAERGGFYGARQSLNGHKSM